MSNEHKNSEEEHGYYTGDIHNQFVEEHVDPKGKKVIWRTFWILLIITIFEVGVSFTSVPKNILLWVFITLTVVKAYFIVYFFMHLKHEWKAFQYTIILPFLLIVYLIFIAITEGNYIHKMLFG
ncbi:MAG: cytochrome C oxidase subunit IV family protein [Bacteroidia bacterium]